MLSLLKITNLALVESLTWETGAGLVCVTGETGAGKSIIVGAIKLVLGERADRTLVRTGCQSCTVEAVFDLSDSGPVNERLEALGLDPCEDDQLLIKRVVGARSGSRQFVNASPTTLAALKGLSHFLVDLHGPHEHQALIAQERQLHMLDAFAGADAHRRACRETHRVWKGLSRELEDLTRSERATEQEIDLLRYQIQDIAAVDPQPEELEPLERRYRLANNASSLVTHSRKILGLLEDSEGSVLDQLGDCQRHLRELQGIDPRTAEFTREFDGAHVALEEMAQSLRRYAEGLELDPAELAEIEQRINALETLKRKYGSTIEEVLAFRERAEAKLARIEGRGETAASLEGRIREARGVLEGEAARLTRARQEAAPKLARRIAAHLKDLGFKRSQIAIERVPLEEISPLGAETIDFIFAPNPGEPPMPLRLIASSGEMARVMLAVKSALARQDNVPLLVFDEIDANVGGEIASAVGAKMAELARTHQVISITHLPQVAALADSHCVVEKEFAGKRTRSVLRSVSGEERVGELARMLGGDRTSAAAHARNLLARES